MDNSILKFFTLHQFPVENFVTWDNHQLCDKSAVEIVETSKKTRHLWSISSYQIDKMATERVILLSILSFMYI